MKFLKFFFSIVTLFVVLAFIAFGLILYLIDPNKIKPVLVSQIEERTGYHARIDGALTWSIYPHLGIKINHMTLSNPGEAMPFIEMSQIRVAAELAQLIRGKQSLQGNLHMDDVKLMTLHATNASVGLSWENNQLRLQPITADLYDGTLSGVAHARDLSSLPQWDWDVTVTHVQLQSLLKEVNGKDSRLLVSGWGQIALKAATTGKNKDQLLSHLNGLGSFSLDEGVLMGMDLDYFLSTAEAFTSKVVSSVPHNTNQTKFEKLNGHFSIKNGLVETKDLVLTTAKLKTRTIGEINLSNKTMKLECYITPPALLNIKWDIPISLSGSLSNPNIDLDVHELERSAAKEELEKVKEKVKEKIDQNITGPAVDVLKKLLGG